jgi:hypothetical protein
MGIDVEAIAEGPLDFCQLGTTLTSLRRSVVIIITLFKPGIIIVMMIIILYDYFYASLSLICLSDSQQFISTSPKRWKERADGETMMTKVIVKEGESN